MVLVVKNPPASVGDIRDAGSILGLGRSPGGGHGNPLQYSCLENPMDRGTWWATVHAVTQNQTRLKQLSMNTFPFNRKKNKSSNRYQCTNYIVSALSLWDSCRIEITLKCIKHFLPCLHRSSSCQFMNMI